MNRGRDTSCALLRDRAAGMGINDRIWVSEAGKPFTQSAAICKHLTRLLREAGIPQEYTAYSIRHALITALFDMGLSETRVNAFTGHSNNSHTALSNYFHLDTKWVGQSLIGTSPLRDFPEGAEVVVGEDNEENLADEGIENEDHDPKTQQLTQPGKSNTPPPNPPSTRDEIIDGAAATQISQALSDLFAKRKPSTKKYTLLAGQLHRVRPTGMVTQIERESHNGVRFFWNKSFNNMPDAGR
jgi:hypothetical protein